MLNSIQQEQPSVPQEAHIQQDLNDPQANADHPQDQLQGNQEEQKYTTLQIKAWIASGQPLNLPGYQWPGPLPHVQMGAR